MELTRALQRLKGDEFRLLVPPGGSDAWEGAINVGRGGGQFWEQWHLPHHAADGILLNLGNVAPLRTRRQIVVIHDAGVFGAPEAYSWKFRIWYKTLQKILVMQGVPVVTVSEFSRIELLRHLRAAPEQVQVIPEGADHINGIVANEAILAKHGLKPGYFVLAVGNLAAHKNLPALDVLAERLVPRGAVLVVVGNLGGKVFRSGGAPDMPQAARYIGRVTDEELKALYQAAACFVFPSRYEGFGLPAVEAMASRCPVVAADIAALREACGKAAVYCDPTSPVHIADSALEVYDDPILQERMCLAGLEQTRDMTWDRAAGALLNIITKKFEMA